MAELGIVGLVLILGFLGFAIVSGVRRGPTRSPGAVLGAALAVFAAGIVSAAIDWTWELPACFGLVVLAAALLTGPATLEPEPAFGAVPEAVDGWRARASGSRPSRFGLGVATLLVGWAAIWAGGDPLPDRGQARRQPRRRRAPATSSPPRRTRATRARSSRGRRTPGFSSRWSRSWTATCEAANRDLGEAIERAPDNWQLWFVRARLEVKSGDVDGARRALDACPRAQPAGAVPVAVTARVASPRARSAGRAARMADSGRLDPGRERWILPFAAVWRRGWSSSGWRRRPPGSIGDGC